MKYWAIKGAPGLKRIWPLQKTKGKNGSIFLLGVDLAKDILYSRLKIPEAGPGFIHFPIGDNFGAEFYAQLTGEVFTTKWRNQRPFRAWVAKRGQAVEVLDCWIYAYAAKLSLGRRDGMLTAPKPVYTSEINLDSPEPPVTAPVKPPVTEGVTITFQDDFAPVVKPSRKDRWKRYAGANQGRESQVGWQNR